MGGYFAPGEPYRPPVTTGTQPTPEELERLKAEFKERGGTVKVLRYKRRTPTDKIVFKS
jgi:hypothetical protein